MTLSLLLPAEFEAPYRQLVEHDLARVCEVRERFWIDRVSPDELVSLAAESEILVVTVEQIDVETIARLSELRLIAKFGAGTDNIDIDGASRRGIWVTNAPGANSASVAQMALSLILSCARSIPEADQVVRAGEWRLVYGTEISGKTLGVIGTGRIGRALIRMLEGFQMRVLAWDRVHDESLVAIGNTEYVELSQIAEECDVISVHLPLARDTRGILNSDFFRRMKRRPIFVNTARGEVVDEKALCSAIESGSISAVGVDVLGREPPRATDPLLQFPNVLVTPHIGGSTMEAISRIGAMLVEDVRALESGEQPPHAVNTDDFDRSADSSRGGGA